MKLSWEMLSRPFQIFMGMFPGVDDVIQSGYDLAHWEDKVIKDKYSTFPATILLKRILTIAAVALLIAGFVGALAVPIPGVAPLYTLAAVPILKAIGITIGYAALVRTIGSFLGSCIDKLISRFDTVKEQVLKKINPFEVAINLGFLGELGARAKNKIIRQYNEKMEEDYETVGDFRIDGSRIESSNRAITNRGVRAVSPRSSIVDDYNRPRADDSSPRSSIVDDDNRPNDSKVDSRVDSRVESSISHGKSKGRG